MEKIVKTDEQWRAELSPEQYDVCRQRGTEPAFSGALYAHKEAGTYTCACCGNALFASGTKFDSGSGWPSFFDVVSAQHVEVRRDTSHGMIREEVVCARCDAHLGHVFPDGPPPTGLRYCINSVCIGFKGE